jgi:hypothetical protein
MADEPKAKGILSKKIAGIPAPVVLIVGGVAAYYLYTKYKGSASSTAPSTDTSTGQPGYADDSGSGGGGSGGGGGSPTTTTGTTTGTGMDYTGTGTTTGATTSAPIFDTAQPGNPYGQGVAYVEPGVGDLPPGVLPVVYNPPNTTALTAASGALASNPAQGGHSL